MHLLRNANICHLYALHIVNQGQPHSNERQGDINGRLLRPVSQQDAISDLLACREEHSTLQPVLK